LSGLPGAIDSRATIGSGPFDGGEPAVRAVAVGAAAAREVAADAPPAVACFPFARLLGTLVTPARFKLSKRCRTIRRASAMFSTYF
jgi:hypothetical protein